MPISRAQVGLAGAVMPGKSHAMPRKVAQEMLDKMKGRKMSSLPQHAGDKHPRLKAKLMGRRKRGM